MVEFNNRHSFFKDQNDHAFTALEKAHFISFAPYAFQASVLLRDFDILKKLYKSDKGLSFTELMQDLNISHYGLRILVEAGIGIGLIQITNDIYTITKTGVMFINDPMVRVNTNFMRDICYEGSSKLKESILNGKPEGLPYLGEWNTIYEGLSKLNPQQKTSWFEFDNYYSDQVFPIIMPYLFSYQPKHILDIGCNTGKFSIECLKYNAEVNMHLIDLPGQIKIVKKILEDQNISTRYELIEHNILDQSNDIPGKYDIIWMSQFLDCFSDDEIVGILQKCKQALNPNGKIIINETFWDQQKFHAAMYSLQMTSLYFTTMANGNSQMYDSQVFIKLIEKAGLKLIKEEHQIATTHSLLTLSL